MCDNDPDCVAYNYERRDQLACELNDQLALKYGENLKPAPGWDYYEKHRETREHNSCDGIQKPLPGTWTVVKPEITNDDIDRNRSLFLINRQKQVLQFMNQQVEMERGARPAVRDL